MCYLIQLVAVASATRPVFRLDGGEPPVDVAALAHSVWTPFAEAMAGGIAVAGVFLGVRLLWSWLVAAPQGGRWR